MTNFKSEVAGLTQQLVDAEIDFDLNPYTGGMRRTQNELAQVGFETRSPCQNIVVYMTGDGVLEDIVIREDALKRLNHDQMARRLTETIQNADEVARTALESVMRRQGTTKGTS